MIAIHKQNKTKHNYYVNVMSFSPAHDVFIVEGRAYSRAEFNKIFERE